MNIWTVLPGRLLVVLVIASIAVFAAAGCGRGNSTSWDLSTPADGRTWPEGDQEARIRFLGSINGQEDIGAGRSSLSRLRGLVFGTPDDGLVRPSGISGDGSVVVVADMGNHALHLFDMQRKSYKIIRGTEQAPLSIPVGVALGAGRIFASAPSLGRVFLYDTGGTFLDTLQAELERPTGIAVDKRTGRLYVSDTHAHRIAVFDSSGLFEQFLGHRGREHGEFNFPTYLAVGPRGHLYVVDSLNFRVQQFDTAGNFVSTFGEQGDGSGFFSSPKGIALDGEGHIYVVDALFDAVQVFDSTGQFLLGFGGRGDGIGQLWLPAGIHIDGEDRIYVSDSYNQRIQVYEFLEAEHLDQ